MAAGLNDDGCIRGCTVKGVHFASCPDFGAEAGACRGCAPRPRRDGAVLCERCFYRLQRALEDLPDLVGMLRAKADPLQALDYSKRAQRSGSRGPDAPAPVSVDLLDAIHDLMRGVGVRHIEPGQASDQAYELTLDAVGGVLWQLDAIAADEHYAVTWCEFAFRANTDDEPWTIAGALRRWPMEERSRFAPQPCPECQLRTVKITPPRHKHARLWMVCESCGWRRNESDDDGLWAAAFGYHHDNREDSDMGEKKITKADIDIAEAFTAGSAYVAEHPDMVKEAGAFGPFVAFLVGATPALAEQFAQIADLVAKDARQYINGDLIAGGARMVAKAIRQAAENTEAASQLTLGDPIEVKPDAAA